MTVFSTFRNGFRAAAFAAALLLALLALAATPWSPDEGGSATAGSNRVKAPPAPLFDLVVPQVRAAREAAHAKPRKGETSIAVLRRRASLRTEPGGGKRIARLARRSEFGSARVLAVIGRRDGWLRVLAAELPNNRSGWIPASAARLETTPWALRADVSKREVVVLKRGKVVRRFGATMGRSTSPTPTGRFGVTDKILFRDSRGPYGCCALALTGHQTKLPAGWTGGDRLAIHSTRSGVGNGASAGCLRADRADASWVVRRVLLGSVMTIER